MNSSQWQGFDRATSAAYTKNRVIACCYGEPGTRKTSFALEAPGPIAVFSLNYGLEGVVNRELDNNPDKAIYVKEYEWMPDKDTDGQQEAKDVRDEFMTDYKSAISIARTVIIDLETEFWALFRYAEFGPRMNGEQRDYDALNSRYRKLINMCKSTSANFFFIGGMQDEWGTIEKPNGRKGSGPTGRRKRAGFSELEGMTHVSIMHDGHGPDTWTMSIGKVRGPGNQTLADNTFPFTGDGSISSFQDFAMAMFPKSDESEWV